MRLALVAVVLMLVGCGGGDGGEGRERGAAAQEPRLAPAEYARRVDRLCVRVTRQAAPFQERVRTALARGGSDREQMARVADVLEEQLAVVTRFREDVEKVALPRAHADDARSLVEKTKAAETELNEAIDALRAGEEQRATEALRRYAGLSLQSASIARDSELPFAICGAGA
jgi:hypothetical protein